MNGTLNSKAKKRMVAEMHKRWRAAKEKDFDLLSLQSAFHLNKHNIYFLNHVLHA